MNSKSEARRAVKDNAIKVNDELISDEKRNIDLKDLTEDNLIKISFGKKKHYIIKAT
jgi:tyrosyl-tRNA synthetase